MGSPTVVTRCVKTRALAGWTGGILQNSQLRVPPGFDPGMSNKWMLIKSSEDPSP